MTGAGAPGAAGIIRCLKQDPSVKLTVADADPEAVGRYLHPEFVQLPKGDDPSFAAALLDLCLDRSVDLVMPLVTKELLPLSRQKQRFEEAGIRLLVSGEKAITIANDKCETYRFLQGKGIQVPRFFLSGTREEFIHAAFELGHPAESFCFKPCRSNGSRGVRVVHDSLDESDQLFHHKPWAVNITYTHALSILSSKPFPPLLVSEYLPGMEYSVDCLAKNGKAVLIVPRSRRKTQNGISIQGCFEKNEAIISYCRQIIEAIGLHGNIGIQVKLRSNGDPLLLEINPRVQGTIVSALGAGINLPLLAVRQELNLQIPEEDLKVKWGTRFWRYWNEVYY
jgi:carbamoyl-phosphate synthase large subunit